MSNMNPFLKPVHETLTSEFRPYSELREQVNAMIQDGSFDSGIHESCAYAWFDELVETGFAERQIETLYRGKIVYGSRAYFRAA